MSVCANIVSFENVKDTVGKNLKRASSDVLNNMNKVTEKKSKIKSKKLSKKTDIQLLPKYIIQHFVFFKKG